MVIGALGLEFVAVLSDKNLCEGSRVADYLFSIGFPRGLRDLQQRGSNRSNSLDKVIRRLGINKEAKAYVIVWATLACGENGIIHTLLKILCVLDILAEENETSTGTTESLVSEKRSLQVGSMVFKLTHVVVVTTWQ